ncbi:MAG TPA: PAS domain-containing protein, partial [Gemmatimonadaceae bacterium]|nr:PAS domain-containing protein [Gemmatimonadaceae bacterium]
MAARLLRVPVARVVTPDGTPLGRVARRVVRRQMSFIVPDVRRAPSSVVDAAAPAGWGALLAVPIPALRAALVVADTVAREWRDDDVAALTDLAATLVGPRPPEAPAWLRRMVRFEVHEARRKSEARLALIFDSTMDFIVLAAVERDGFRCSAANEACLAVTGLTATQVLGRRMEEVLGDATWARVLPRVITAARHGEPLRWEEEFPLVLGRATLETTLTPILDDAGQCTHLLAVSRDV